MNQPEKNDDLLTKVKELVGMGLGRYRIMRLLGIKEKKARILISKVIGKDKVQKDTFYANVQHQKILDISRASRKNVVEKARQISAIEELTKEMIKVLDKNNLSKFTRKERKKQEKGIPVGVIHLSDIHFNELIDIHNNKYDFNIASKRLHLLAQRAKTYFRSMGVSRILIAMTGDMINSDRRLEEIVNMATNRTKATFLAVDILQQFILDLNTYGFDISVAYVSGNESRVNSELGWNKNVVSDSYDTTIFYMLKSLFKGSDTVSFLDGDPSEHVIEINGMTFLLLHGHGCIGQSEEKSIEQMKGRYASHGIIVDYVIFGHIHSAIIGDHFSRCSSLCGSNAYNERSLNIRGRASQNLYVVHEGLIDGIKIDLQIVEGEQYPFDNSLEEYNPKSEEKSKKKNIIINVVV